MNYKKGDTVEMLFYCFGEISKEECKVVTVHKNKTITLDNGFRFNTDNGACVNDETSFGCCRKIAIG